MSRLTIYPHDQPQTVLSSLTHGSEICGELAALGVRFERWNASVDLGDTADLALILAAYAPDLERWRRQGGYTSADVVRLKPDHPEREALRRKFLAEHTHSEDEIRFFVEGGGTFYLHENQHVFQIRCERGDLLYVPANAKHWFDMGAEPNFTAIRLFTDPAGWVGHFTGDDIASRFPLHDE